MFVRKIISSFKIWLWALVVLLCINITKQINTRNIQTTSRLHILCPDLCIHVNKQCSIYTVKERELWVITANAQCQWTSLLLHNMYMWLFLRLSHLLQTLWCCLSILITTCSHCHVNPYHKHTHIYTFIALFFPPLSTRAWMFCMQVHKEIRSGVKMKNRSTFSSGFNEPCWQQWAPPILSSPVPGAKPKLRQGWAPKIKTQIDAGLRKG